MPQEAIIRMDTVESTSPSVPVKKRKIPLESIESNDSEDVIAMSRVSPPKNEPVEKPLRRRDQIRSTQRYSPPPPAKSNKGRKPASSMNMHKNVVNDSDNRSADRFSSEGKEAVNYEVDIQRDSTDSSKYNIFLPDGTT